MHGIETTRCELIGMDDTKYDEVESSIVNQSLAMLEGFVDPGLPRLGMESQGPSSQPSWDRFLHASGTIA